MSRDHVYLGILLSVLFVGMTVLVLLTDTEAAHAPDHEDEPGGVNIPVCCTVLA